ncbi:MAG TPA: DUF2225 domain-containing protein [bacterium]|nr:DUF2225 domain-containing protein [bacterium]
MSTPLWNKKVKCPFCHAEFESTRMRSSVIRIKDKMTDFGNIYEGEVPYFYSITACPQCTFAALHKDFESVKPQYEPKVLEACQKIVKSGRKKPDIFMVGPLTPPVAALRHELAIGFMKMRVYKDLGALAGLYMHLVWILRIMGDREKELAAMAEAAKAYEVYHEKGGDLPESLGEPGVLYLIGELNRRIGNYKEARRYYERALGSKEIKSFPRIADQTRDMMLIAKNQAEQAETA